MLRPLATALCFTAFASLAACSHHDQPAPEVRPAEARPDAAHEGTADGGAAEVTVRIPPGLEQSGRVTTEPAHEGAVHDEIEAPCEVVAAPDGIATVATAVVARVVEWHVTPGQIVRARDAIVTLDSREVAELRTQIARGRIDAQDFAGRVREEAEMLTAGATSPRSAREASAGLARAREQMSAAQRTLASLGASETGPSGRFTLRTPIAGTVTRREGSLGDVVEPSSTGGTSAVLASIVDLARARIAAHLPEDAADVGVGAHALVTLRGHSGSVPSTVVWRDPTLARDTRTRTVQLRPDATVELSLEQTGTARVERPGAARGVVVPAAAVYREGNHAFVFVRRSPGEYLVRPVVLGRGAGSTLEIASGLSAGEPVVVSGTFLVASQYTLHAGAGG